MTLLVLRTLLVASVGWLLGCEQPKTSPQAEAPRGPLRAAVAANFAEPAMQLARAFEEKQHNRVEISTGSSGKLYAQIDNGAPFHVFLSADADRPRLLENRDLAVKGSRFTYAVGRLAMYGSALQHPEDGAIALQARDFAHLAIANPETAPYGAAAKQALEKLGHWQALSPTIVRGENIAHAFQFVESGGAELGFVALSAVVKQPTNRYWVVPSTLHDPLRQDAVLLTSGADHPVARAFLEFLRSPPAHRIIETAGYGTGQP